MEVMSIVKLSIIRNVIFMKIRCSDSNMINSLLAVSRPPPPANVTIQCDNYGVEARWEYPDQSRDVHFFVEVTYSDGR